MLGRNLTTPVILDVEFLLCGVLGGKGQYVTSTDNFLNCFYIFSLKLSIRRGNRQKIFRFSFEMQKPIVYCFEHYIDISGEPRILKMNGHGNIEQEGNIPLFNSFLFQVACNICPHTGIFISFILVKHSSK